MRFILVDRILSMEPGRTIHAVKTLPESDELFLDHFPGFPVVPGVLLVEMMAQASAKCLHAEGTDRGYSMLGQINSATFRDWVRPGQVIDIHATVVLSRDKFATTECHIAVEEQTRASAKLLFSFVPRDSFAPDYRDSVLEEYLHRSVKQQSAH
jgi:3-hydroxyacyl-[acyl-carrier-protein] dehydratase